MISTVFGSKNYQEGKNQNKVQFIMDYLHGHSFETKQGLIPNK